MENQYYKCNHYKKPYPNKVMSGGARCAQPGLIPIATGQFKANYFTYGGNRGTNKLFI